jgi:NADH-quinone oxidoreductase subunit L
MAGPTPTSALIHAATMVTAGVYLIARMNSIFRLAPNVLLLVAAIGAVTLVLAGFSAAVQRDIKRVLAYSTISQIGYMFLALGVGAFSAALFHLATHAFFKALLFLAAGAIIHALDNEQDLFKMGGLRKALPTTFWTFLVGAAALVALPPTGGFASKDLILELTWAAGPQVRWLWVLGMLGAFLTAYYSFRMLFLAFFGPPRAHVHHRPGLLMTLPLVILAIGSVLTAGLDWPAALGGTAWFSPFLHTVLPAGGGADVAPSTALALQAASLATALAGILAAWLAARRLQTQAPAATAFQRLLFSGFGFDLLYDRLFVRPFLWLARKGKDDVIDSVYDAAAWTAGQLHRLAARTQTGQLRWYTFALAAGAALLLAIMVLR